MVRNLVACAVLAVAGALFCLPDPGFAGPRGGAMPAFRPAMIMHALRPHFFRGAHRPFAPGRFGHHRAPSVRPYGTVTPSTPYGTVKPSTPYGTVKPSTPYGTVASSRPYGTVAPSAPRFARMTLSHPRSHLTRRHHRIYHAGWSFPVTIGGEVDYIGTPYDPAELIPVYGPAPEPAEPATAPTQRAAPRVSATREDNPDACRSERVTVPASEGEREITVVRC